MIRKYDYRRAKGNRYYTIATLAKLYGVHTATVRAWIKYHGLDCAIIDATRPILMKGNLIRAWMKDWQDNRGWKCMPGQISCLSCKAARHIIPETFEIVMSNTDKITVCGTCIQCGGRLQSFNLKANISKLNQDFGQI